MTDWPLVAERLRDFLEGADQYVKEPGGEDRLREALRGGRPFAALAFLVMRSPTYRAGYLPDILAAVANGPHQSLLLARDALRSLPRAALEGGVPSSLSEALREADEEGFRRLAEVVVELRLAAALAVLRRVAKDHPIDEIRDLHDELDGVENDQDRWGRLVQEWPIRGVG